MLGKLAASLAIAAACLWMAARHVDLNELRVALAGFNLLYLIPAVTVSLLIQVFRAWRWKIELSPLADLKFSLVWQVVAVAYMMINVLPFRLGEPVRPVLLSWKTDLTIPAIVGNWVFEKMMDMAAIVFFLHVALLVTDLPDWATKAAMASLAAFAVVVLLVVGFWLRGEVFFNATLGRVLPAGPRAKALKILEGAREGLQILPDRRLVAVVFAVTLPHRFDKRRLGADGWIGDAVTAAATILIITGAGGAFGKVLQASGIADVVGDALAGAGLGVWLPFLGASAIKTAQGSSTVSIITTAGLMAPLLETLSLDSETARALVVVSIGAGAMVVSHANDSYFWVVTQLSDMDLRTGIRLQTMGTLVQGTVAATAVWLICLFAL